MGSAYNGPIWYNGPMPYNGFAPPLITVTKNQIISDPADENAGRRLRQDQDDVMDALLALLPWL